MSSPNETKPTPPAWLRWFGNDAARAIIDSAAHAPIGCHYFYVQDRNEWEVSIFISATEVVGGAKDGTVVPCRMQADISHLAQLFDELPGMHWQTGVIDDGEDLGQHVSLEGQVRGHRVWLRLLAEAPCQSGPGRLLHALTGELEDIW